MPNKVGREAITERIVNVSIKRSTIVSILMSFFHFSPYVFDIMVFEE
jgi:hypothetical protein